MKIRTLYLGLVICNALCNLIQILIGIKEGSHFDLPIALAILGAAEVLSCEELEGFIAMGELSLDGKINAVNGVLPAAIFANEHEKTLICPAANKQETHWSGTAPVMVAENLLQLINYLTEKQFPENNQHLPSPALPANNYPLLEDVKGQHHAKRALEIAAAGGHNILMIGSPGSGKSMLAQRLPAIMPPLCTREILETSIISSIAGHLDAACGLQTQRPFRAPHSSSSLPAMVGGGKHAKPGEVTLAHNGILFLDELPEFSRNVLEALRQPVEANIITIARVNSHITYPANFLLIAAMNPCRCGYFGDASMACSKAPKCAEDYQSRISGPLYDRFDLQVEVAPIDIRQYQQDNIPSDSTAEVAARVQQARALQYERYGSDAMLNAEVSGKMLEQAAPLDAASQEMLTSAMLKFKMSMRAYSKILRVARTLADLDGQEHIAKTHLAEALSFRLMRLKS